MLPLFAVNPAHRTPVVVLAFIAANAVVWIVELAQGSEAAMNRFVHTWGLVPANLWRQPDGPVWFTPFSSMFMHGGWLHLAGNCWFLWIFGHNIEDRMGHVRFVAFYVVCGVAAAVAQVAIGPFSPIPMIGASGAISGVLGAYMRLFPKAPIFTLVPFFIPVVPVPAFIFMGVWFVFQFWRATGSLLSSGVTGGVAWWAHIGGFLAGWWLAARMQPARKR